MPFPLPATLSAAAVTVMTAPYPADKVLLTRRAVTAWRKGDFASVGYCQVPNRPARPEKPERRAPADMPRRSKGGEAGRAAFVHAIAHIELNAIDLAWDIIARFTDEDMPTAFYDDWVEVALDEAEHFEMLSNRLGEMGYAYGDLPAHDGLWEAAENTADDLLARLALVPMVLEARGLDTTPKAVTDLEAAGDRETARILAKIGREEVPHVAAGVRWFEYICEQRQLEPTLTFHGLVNQRFAGTIKPPFNRELRDAAGMSISYYEPVTAGPFKQNAKAS